MDGKEGRGGPRESLRLRHTGGKSLGMKKHDERRGVCLENDESDKKRLTNIRLTDLSLP